MPEPDKTKLKAYAIFSNGGISIIGDVLPDKEIMENDVKKVYNYFYLKPLTKLRIEEKITEKDEGFQNTGHYLGFYKKKYLKEYCKPLSLSPRSAVWLLYSDWNGKFIDILGGEQIRLFDKLNRLKAENSGLRKAMAALRFEFIKMSKDPLQYQVKNSERISKIFKNYNIVVTSNPSDQSGEESHG